MKTNVANMIVLIVLSLPPLLFTLLHGCGETLWRYQGALARVASCLQVSSFSSGRDRSCSGPPFLRRVAGIKHTHFLRTS